MLLEVWSNGLTHSDHRVLFIDVTDTEPDVAAEGFRLFKLAREDAMRWGQVDPGYKAGRLWYGPATTLRAVLEDLSWWFYGEVEEDDRMAKAHLHDYKRFMDQNAARR